MKKINNKIHERRRIKLERNEELCKHLGGKKGDRNNKMDEGRRTQLETNEHLQPHSINSQ